MAVLIHPRPTERCPPDAGRLPQAGTVPSFAGTAIVSPGAIPAYLAA